MQARHMEAGHLEYDVFIPRNDVHVAINGFALVTVMPPIQQCVIPMTSLLNIIAKQ